MEEETLEKARALEEASLARIVEEFHPRIYRYYYFRTRSKEDAEDLTGEVFLKMVKSVRKQRGNFPAWLFKIAKNLLIDYYRKKGKEEVLLKTAEIETFPASDEKDIGEFTSEELRTLLGLLNAEQKEVIVLKFIEGYSNKEIASIIDRSEGAIKALQFRALTHLRDLVKSKRT